MWRALTGNHAIAPRLLALALAVMASVTAALAIAVAALGSSREATLAASFYAVAVAWYVALIAVARKRPAWVGPGLVILVAVCGIPLSALEPDIAPIATIAALAFATVCLPYFSNRVILGWAAVAMTTSAVCIAAGKLRPFGERSLEGPVVILAAAAVGIGFMLFVVMLHYRSSLSRTVAQLDAQVEDRTKELQAATDEAHRAARAKADFLSSMSHEIRTPMNAVIGMTSLLVDGELTLEQRDIARTIRSSGEHLLMLINDVLDFSKIDAGKLELETLPFDVVQIVEDSIGLVGGAANAKDLDVVYELGDGVPARVTSDPGRLRQILTNLLSNAVKFTERGEVVVRIERAGAARLAFHVRDTGIGIKPDQMSRLFQPFSQADAATNRKYGGSGLGLVIAQRLAQAMGGDIAIDTKVDAGSTFSFELDAPAIEADGRARPNRALRVLVVDDNAASRSAIAQMLTGWGMTCTLAESASAALAGELDVDLLLIDHHMHGADGVAAIRELATRGKTVPVVLMSPEPLTPEARAAAPCATKPLRQSQLYDAIVTAIEGRRPSRPAQIGSAIDRTLAERQPLRILVAEDNAVNQKVVVALLARMGYAADVVANGDEAIASVERQPYDVVLMDVQMPETDGLTATRMLRTRGRTIWIVALTANATDSDRRACLEAGMNDYVSKPITPASLAAALERVPTASSAAAASKPS